MVVMFAYFKITFYKLFCHFESRVARLIVKSRNKDQFADIQACFKLRKNIKV